MHTISTLQIIKEILNFRSQKLFALVILLFLGLQSQLLAQTSCPISNEISISVYLQPTISLTGATTICATGSATLTATPSGGVPGTCSVTWEYRTDTVSGTWTPITNTNSNPNVFITPNLAVSTQYHALLTCTETSCTGATSNAQTITVNPSIAITTQPIGFEECTNGVSSLSVSTLGGTGNIVYTWYSGADSLNMNVIAGAIGSTYTPVSTSNGTTYYKVSVSSGVSGCGSKTSFVAKVIVYPILTITTQPIGFEECVGGNQTLNVSINGGVPSSTKYQWQSSPDGSTWKDSIGQTNSTLIPTSINAGVRYYQLNIVSGGSNCGFATSTPVKVTVSPQTAIVTDLKDITECIGGTDSLNFVTSGGASNVTYIWESSTSNVPATFTAIAGAASLPIFTPNHSVIGTTYYRVRITSSFNTCTELDSRISTVTINPILIITSHPSDIDECSGGNQILNVSTSGGITSPPLKYQWQYSPDNITWKDSIGQTASTLIPQSLNAGTRYYRVTVTSTGSNCGQVTSNSAKVIIRNQISISAQAQPIVECTNGNQTLTVTATGGSGVLHYKWYLSNSLGGSYTPIPNSDSTSYTPNSVSDGITYYRVDVSATGNGCGVTSSNPVQVDVRKQLLISTDLVGFIECETGKQTLTVAVINGTSTNSTSNLTYQWFSSPTQASGFTPIANSNNATYTPPSTTDGTTYYYIQISDSGAGCSPIPSKTVAVTINPQLTINAQPQNLNECTNGNQTITVGILNGAGGMTFQWQKSSDGITFADTVGATNQTFLPPSTSAGTIYYQVIVTSTGNGCKPVTSKISKVVVAPQISVVTPPQNIDECVGGTVPLSVVAKDGSGTFTYQWQSSPDQSSWVNITGETNSTYNHPPSTTAGVTYYQCLINTPNATNDNACKQATSGIAKVTIFSKPVLTTMAKVTAVCTDGQVELNATKTGGTGTCVITWQVSTDNGATFKDVPSQPTSPDSKYVTPPLKANTKYHATITCSGSGCCN